MQQKSARTVESVQAAMHAQDDKAQQQLAQASASLEEARSESEQVRLSSQRRCHLMSKAGPKSRKEGRMCQ